MTPTTSKKSILLLTIIPVGLFLLSIVLHAIKGPYCLGPNADPEYAYLFNSLNILNFDVPGHIHHPGTPLQVLGAFVLLGKWLVISSVGAGVSLQNSVLANPESYLRTINIFLNLLISGATFFAGFQLVRCCKRLLPAITLQVTMLLFLQIQTALGRVSPEPLLIFSVLMLTICLIPEVFGNNSNQATAANNNTGAVLTGVALGFGLATKVTFLPLMLFVFLFEEARKKRLALLSCLLAFLFFTLPILPAYPKMLRWFRVLLIHKGKYGQGDLGFPGIHVLAANLKALFLGQPFLFISLGLYLLIYVFLKKYRKQNSSLFITKIQKLLWIGCLIIIVQVAMTVKHPASLTVKHSPHLYYMLPAMLITGLMNAAVVFLYQKLERRPSLMPLIVIIGFLGVGLGFNYVQADAWAENTGSFRLAGEELLSKLTGLKDCLKIGHYYSPRIEHALATGNYRAGKKYTSKLQQMYPDTLFYYIWTNSFGSYDRAIKKSEILAFLNKGGCVVLFGRPFVGYYQRYQADLILEPIMIKSEQALYRLTGFKDNIAAAGKNYE